MWYSPWSLDVLGGKIHEGVEGLCSANGTCGGKYG